MMHGHEIMEHMSMMGPHMWFFMILLWGFAIFGIACMLKWVYDQMRDKRSHSNH